MSVLKRLAAIVQLLVLLMAPATLWALGVGGMNVSSGLNQPFDARIPIIGAGEGEIPDVTARLAEPEVFERAGLSRPHALTRLRFLVVADEQGGGYIHVTSRNGIREPALEFIVEVSWRSGSLRRKYSVLLEPR